MKVQFSNANIATNNYQSVKSKSTNSNKSVYSNSLNNPKRVNFTGFFSFLFGNPKARKAAEAAIKEKKDFLAKNDKKTELIQRRLWHRDAKGKSKGLFDDFKLFRAVSAEIDAKRTIVNLEEEKKEQSNLFTRWFT